MSIERIDSVTYGWSPLRAIGRVIRLEVARAELVAELERLSPAALADVGIERQDIRAFARASVRGEMLPPRHLRRSADEPVTQIGSEVWARASLLHMG